MRKIAVLFPTRYRPELFKRALESWKKRSECSDVYIAFQSDDPCLSENKDIAGNLPYILCENIGLAAKVNLLCHFRCLKEYDAYMILNDDQIIHTQGWDRILLDRLDLMEKMSGHRLWILHWKDGIHDEKLPQSFATKELLSIIETYNPVNYMKHLFIDNVYKYYGDRCGILHYVPEVFIEHLHEKRNSRYKVFEEARLFEKWKEEKGTHLVQKIQKELESIEGL